MAGQRLVERVLHNFQGGLDLLIGGGVCILRSIILALARLPYAQHQKMLCHLGGEIGIHNLADPAQHHVERRSGAGAGHSIAGDGVKLHAGCEIWIALAKASRLSQ